MARNPLGGLLKRRQHDERKAVMPFGDRTPEQREAALVAAREARKETAALLTDVRSGKVGLADILGEDFRGNERAQRLRVETLLRALPGVGGVTAEKAMDAIGIPENRRVAGLGVAQRRELLERFAR